ncbi:hypothetical protein V5O48_016301 [Marasmius crinis-equi]|uniref:Uncharacterized protein n=1 Tax=Marasmius crinis-equi TaxID=585013 RepID=A0ABR3ES55_9AGAR
MFLSFIKDRALRWIKFCGAGILMLLRKLVMLPFAVIRMWRMPFKPQADSAFHQETGLQALVHKKTTIEELLKLLHDTDAAITSEDPNAEAKRRLEVDDTLWQSMSDLSRNSFFIFASREREEDWRSRLNRLLKPVLDDAQDRIVQRLTQLVDKQLPALYNTEPRFDNHVALSVAYSKIQADVIPLFNEVMKQLTDKWVNVAPIVIDGHREYAIGKWVEHIKPVLMATITNLPEPNARGDYPGAPPVGSSSTSPVELRTTNIASTPPATVLPLSGKKNRSVSRPVIHSDAETSPLSNRSSTEPPSTPSFSNVLASDSKQNLNVDSQGTSTAIPPGVPAMSGLFEFQYASKPKGWSGIGLGHPSQPPQNSNSFSFPKQEDNVSEEAQSTPRSSPTPTISSPRASSSAEVMNRIVEEPSMNPESGGNFT